MGIHHNHKTRARSSRSPVRKAERAIARMLKAPDSPYSSHILLAACPRCEVPPGEYCRRLEERPGGVLAPTDELLNGPHPDRIEAARRMV